jgi:hypothetical protein
MDRCASKSLIAALIALIVMSGSVTAGPVPTAADRSAKASESARGGPLQSRDREGAVLPTPIGHPPSESVPLGEAVHEPAPDLDAAGRPAARPTDRVWYVDSRAPGANDGTSWENAFHDLHDALAVAGNGDEVRVAQGVYTPAGAAGDRDISFVLEQSIALRGGFAGFGAQDPNERDPERFKSLLSGDLNGDDGTEFTNRTDNTRRVLQVSEEVADLLIDGVVFEGAYNDRPRARGSALVLDGRGATELRHCVFRDNHGWFGGATSSRGRLDLMECTFSGNRTTAPAQFSGAGAAVFVETGPLKARGCSFTSNAVFIGEDPLANDPAGGGAVALWQVVRAELVDCTFTDNRSDGSGGAVVVLGRIRPTELIIHNCRFYRNRARKFGGAVHGNAPGARVTVEDSVFGKNSASRGGALEGFVSPDQGLFVRTRFENNYGTEESGAADIDGIFISCSFVRNRAPLVGGIAGTGTWIDCLFEENEAVFTGGLHARIGSIVSECRFIRNTAELSTGALGAGGVRLIERCVFVGNKAGKAGALYVSGGNTWEGTVRSCVFVDNRTAGVGSAIVHAGGWPLLEDITLVRNRAPRDGGTVYVQERWPASVSGAVLWNNAGGSFVAERPERLNVSYSLIEGGWPGEGNIDVDPRFVDPDGVTPDFRLRPDSPAINTGDPDRVLTEGERDLDGHPRVLCDRVDMGAYEFGAGDHNCDRAIDLDDFAAWTPCVTGPAGGPYNPGCEALDFDFDGDVDTADFAGFQVVLPR